MRALYLGLAALVTPAHALGKPDITFILGAPHLPCLSLSFAPCSAAEGSGRSWLTDRAPSWPCSELTVLSAQPMTWAPTRWAS